MKDPAITTTPATTTTPAIEERPAKLVRVHRMRIEDGPTTRDQQFVYDEESQSYDPGAVKRRELDPKPEPKPEAKPEPKPEAKPAETDKTSPKAGKTH